MITRVGWTQPPSSHPPVGQGAGAAAGADQLPLVRQGRQKRSQWANGPAPEITTPPKESNGARGTLPGRGKGRGQRPCVPPSEELRAGRTVGGFPAWMQTGLLLLGPNSGWHDHSPPPPRGLHILFRFLDCRAAGADAAVLGSTQGACWCNYHLHMRSRGRVWSFHRWPRLHVPYLCPSQVCVCKAAARRPSPEGREGLILFPTPTAFRQ